MQIPKFLLMLGVATLALSSLQAQRVDTEEQAKARELLRKKMAELEAEQPATPPQQPSLPAPEPAPPPKKNKVQKAAPTVQKAAPEPPPVVAPVVTPAPNLQFPTRNLTGVPPLTLPPRAPLHAQEATPSPVRSSVAGGATKLTPEAQAEAREEMRRKIAELDPSVSAPPAAAAPAKTTVVKPRGKRAEQAIVIRPLPAAPDFSPAPTVVPAARNPDLTPPLTLHKPKPTVPGKKPKYVDQNIFATPAPSTPIYSPIPAAVSGSKNQQLTELLTLYRSNVITPEEYHKRRAEILAQP